MQHVNKKGHERVLEAYEDYIKLLEEGFDYRQAIDHMAEYLHPVTLGRLKKHITEQSEMKKGESA